MKWLLSRKVLHVEKFNTHSEFNSSMIFCERIKLTNFSRGIVCKRANWPTGNSERPVHNFPGNQILTFSWSDQEQARTMADHFASSNVSTRKTRRHLVAFHNQRNWGRFIPGRNDKWNRKFPEFPNFQKKGQPRVLNRNFRNEFPENVCSIRFWTGISGNFGRMERALGLPSLQGDLLYSSPGAPSFWIVHLVIPTASGRHFTRLTYKFYGAFWLRVASWRYFSGFIV